MMGILTEPIIDTTIDTTIDTRIDTAANMTSDDTIDLERYQRLVRRENNELAVQPYQVELLKLQQHLEGNNLRMIVLFEGRDAAGKGGTIRRITRYMNEKRYRVVALGKPNSEEQSQWYMQRYVTQFPSDGEIVLFDRSWYNRAMVEPVLGFCTEDQHESFMRNVVGFEEDLIRGGFIVLKLYFSVTKKEQQRRFNSRKNDPLRSWKLSEVDLQAQDLWDDFTQRKYDMLVRTHTLSCPWTIIRSNDKQKARLNAMKVILNSVDYADRNPDLDFTADQKVVIPGDLETKLMEADLERRGKFKR